ncbi:MAG TPA: hypothetical protein PKV73_16930 [Agriterribacter sp.]|nr:hypothetical protein [Agriterribacter sp.]
MNIIKTHTSVFIIVLCWAISACSKSDDEEKADIALGSLATVPFVIDDIAGIVPLGNLNPPGHTFPTKHTYPYFKTTGSPKSLFAPGNLNVYQISRFRTTVSGISKDDYKIEFGNPNGRNLFFAHVSSLSSKLQTAVGDFSDAVCENYTTGGSHINYCRKTVNVDVQDNEIIGMGGTNPTSYNIDMGAFDNGTAICPLDLFTDEAKALMLPLFGNTSGTIRRTANPLCGEWDLDIAGTAQGNWYRTGESRSLEDMHIALVKDNVQPELPRISIGSNFFDIASGVYIFSTQNTGLINRAFAQVTNDGNTYCYNLKYLYGASVPNTSLILKLENNNTLIIEKRNCNCSCMPYNFTEAKLSFEK